jgi:hypothetical protein
MVVSSTTTIPQDFNISGGVAADCPTGTRRIGGGARTHAIGMAINESAPTPGRSSGWQTTAINHLNAPVDLAAYVLCLRGSG